MIAVPAFWIYRLLISNDVFAVVAPLLGVD
jgi:hypothetical protein